MNINYELYKVFFTVAGCKTITEASKKLYISQPAITKSIKKLEEQLHTSLFIRSVKGIKLTSEGKNFYEHIKPAIEQLFAAENELSVNKKKIIIGIDDIYIQKYLTYPIQKFLEQNEKNKIIIKERKTNDLINDIINQNIDIAITAFDFDNVKNSKIKSVKILDLNLCLIGTTSSKQKIKNDNIQVITTNPNIINYKNKIIVDNYSQVKELIRQNLGIGIIPKEFVIKDINEHKMFIIENNISTKNLYIITNNDIINHNVNKFKNLIIEGITKKSKINNL